MKHAGSGITSGFKLDGLDSEQEKTKTNENIWWN